MKLLYAGHVCGLSLDGGGWGEGGGGRPGSVWTGADDGLVTRGERDRDRDRDRERDRDRDRERDRERERERE